MNQDGKEGVDEKKVRKFKCLSCHEFQEKYRNARDLIWFVFFYTILVGVAGCCFYAQFFEKLDPEGFYGVVTDQDGNVVQKLFPTMREAEEAQANDIQDISTIFMWWYIGTFFAIAIIIGASTGHFWATGERKPHLEWSFKLDWPLMVSGLLFFAIWIIGIFIRFTEVANYVCADYRRVEGDTTEQEITSSLDDSDDLVQEYACNFMRFTLTGMGFYIGGIIAWYALMVVGATKTPIYHRSSRADKHCCFRCLNSCFKCGRESQHSEHND